MMISVVIPTKNRSDKLARALASVAIQTDQNYEVIVVDDGSQPDERGKIADVVAGTRNAVLIRHEISRGAPASRNEGVAASSGEIIATLDSDDWWEPTRLEKHRASLGSGRNAVWSYNRAQLTQGETGSVLGTYGRAWDGRRSIDVCLAAWNFVGGCSSVCFRRDAFLQVGGFDESLPSCQDWDLWRKLVQLSAPAFLAEALTWQDVGPHERITSTSEKVLAGHVAMNRLTEAMTMSKSDRRFVNASQHYVRAELAARFGDGSLALTELGRSLLIHPTAVALMRMPAIVMSSITHR